MNQSKRDKIAARAHEIWEQEGRPDNKAEEHWRRAEQELAREDGADQMGAPAETDQPPEVDTRPAPPIDAAPPLGSAPASGEGADKPKGKSGRSRRPRPPSQQG